MKEPIIQAYKSKMMFNNINIANGNKGRWTSTNIRWTIKINKCSSTFFWHNKCQQATASLIKQEKP